MDDTIELENVLNLPLHQFLLREKLELSNFIINKITSGGGATITLSAIYPISHALLEGTESYISNRSVSANESIFAVAGIDDVFQNLQTILLNKSIKEKGLSQISPHKIVCVYSPIGNLEENMRYCFQCERKFAVTSWVNHIKTREHIEKASKTSSISNIRKISSVFNDRVASYVCDNISENRLDIDEMFLNNKTAILNLMRERFTAHGPLKVCIDHYGEYTNFKDDSVFTYEIKRFNTKFCELLNIDDETLEDLYSEFESKIKTKMDEFQERDSG